MLSDPAATVAEKHAAVLDFKQDVGEKLFAKGGVANKNEAAIEQIAKQDIWGATADNLKSPQAWGEAQAGRNAALDAATRQKINAAKQVAKDFGAHEIDLNSGKNELYIKPSKVLSSLKGDPLANQEKLSHLTDYLDAAKKYAEEVKTSAGTAGAVVPGGDDLHELLDTITSHRQAGEAYRPVEDLLRQARTQPPVGLGAIGAAPLLGGTLHAAGLGIPGAARLSGPNRGPAKPGEGYSDLRKDRQDRRHGQAPHWLRCAENLLQCPGSSGYHWPVQRSALRGRTVQNVNGASAGADFQKQAKHITELASDQERQMSTICS